MPSLRQLVPALAVISVAGLALTGCESTSGGDSEASGGSGTFTVCTNSPYAPFEFEKDGEIVGLRRDRQPNVGVGRLLAVAVPGRVQRDHPVGGGERVTQGAQVGPAGAPAVHQDGGGAAGTCAAVVVGEPEAGPVDGVHLGSSM